mmetsp:Transcript_9669/g.10844  ORF Transcript_9669/g.10844 Transcript_9669/m.10844 type:complete len:211 (-) Transcript_9669:70-702(-)
MLVTNIDLSKLEMQGDKLFQLIEDFEERTKRWPSRQSQGILMIAHLMHQVYCSKVVLIQQDDEWSYEQEVASRVYSSSRVVESPVALEPSRYEFDMDNTSYQNSSDPYQENEEDMDELERQEAEIRMWKGIHSEISKKIKESGSTGEAVDSMRHKHSYAKYTVTPTFKEKDSGFASKPYAKKKFEPSIEAKPKYDFSGKYKYGKQLRDKP